MARVFPIREKVNAEFIAETFNIANTLNVTDINTVYGAPDFTGAVPRTLWRRNARATGELWKHPRHQSPSADSTGACVFNSKLRPT